jgi:amidase
MVSPFCFDVTLQALATEMGRAINEETLEPIPLLAYRYIRGLTAKDKYMADMFLNKLRRTFGQFFLEYDVLLTPTMSQLPQPLGKHAATRADLDFISYNRLGDEIGMYTAPVNMTGQPAISLPLGQSKSGLPIGMQFVARFGDEGTLIRLASSFEKTMPWRDRIPPIHVTR